jgi:glutamate dehydrogenase
MAWMMDEYSRIDEFNSPGFITGKPLVLGGSHGRETATAKGVTICIREAAKKRGIDLKGARVVVQGFGNAGSFLAKFMHDAGAKIIGISDAYGALHDENGLDIDYLVSSQTRPSPELEGKKSLLKASLSVQNLILWTPAQSFHETAV